MNQEEMRTLLTHVSAVIDQQADQLLWERLGVGLAQYRVMTIIDTADQPTQRTVADRLGLTEAGISRQIRLLLEKGYIDRKTNTQNRREHLVRLTAKGGRLLLAAQETMVHYSQKPLEQLDEKRQKSLFAALRTMHDSICTTDDCQHKPYIV